MTNKITDTGYLRLKPEAREFADGFLAVAKPYTATEVARVLTDFQYGVNYMGCGKAHCAAAYAEAKMGKRAGLQTTENQLAKLTMNQFRDLLAAERKRLEQGRKDKADREARWKREILERAAHREKRDQAVELLAMVLDDMDTCCGEAGADYQFKELSTETIEALRAYRAGNSHVPVQGTTN